MEVLGPIGVIGLAWGVLSVLQCIYSLVAGARFYQYVTNALRSPPAGAARPATVFLPCKGVDPELESTLHGLLNQEYPEYEVLAIVESESDPAWRLLKSYEDRAPASGRCRLRVLVASHSEFCSQKIANLLTGVAQAAPHSEIFAFLDSDAVPGTHWLAELTAPLHEAKVGATTGFRWYAPMERWSSLMRAAWNAAALPYMCHPLFNFAWGGSCALLRATFEQVRLAERWKRALSDDFELTRAVRAAGLQIRFVPQCLTPSHDDASWGVFWRFARRQLVIVRVCQPWMWAFAALTAINFVGGLTATLTATVAAALNGQVLWVAVFATLASEIWALACLRAMLVHRAVRKILPSAELHRGVLAMETLGAPLLGLVHLALFVASFISRRFWWRGIHYEMRSPTDLRILGRTSPIEMSMRAS